MNLIFNTMKKFYWQRLHDFLVLYLEKYPKATITYLYHDKSKKHNPRFCRRVLDGGVEEICNDPSLHDLSIRPQDFGQWTEIDIKNPDYKILEYGY